MAKKNNIVYVCSECGHEEFKWSGKCYQCGSWGTFKEMKVRDTKDVSERDLLDIEPTLLKDIIMSESERISTGISELDRVLGGGIVRDSVSMITAKPGAGKSTLLIEIASQLAKKGIKTLYASGEESSQQIKSRAQRILPGISETTDNIFIISTTKLEDVERAVKKIKPKVIFFDSIQTFESENLTNRQGSPTQTVECTSRIVNLCKNSTDKISAFLVGHMTKNSEAAGLQTLQHLVDAVFYLDNDSDDGLRILRSTKNRFGATGEIGIFTMDKDGLKPVDDSSFFFLTKRDSEIEGSSITLVREGTRLIPVEVEALISPSKTQNIMRIADGIRREQLDILASIAEIRGGIELFNKNVILKTAGGLKLIEPSTNLSVLIAIASSYYKFTLPPDYVFLGEVGLTGELKKLKEAETRIKELERLGFKKVFVPKLDFDISDISIEVVQVSTISDLFNIFTQKIDK